jgi:hypothetical protein
MAIFRLEFFIPNKEYIGFEDMTAIIMKRYIFLHATPYSSVRVNLIFGGT